MVGLGVDGYLLQEGSHIPMERQKLRELVAEPSGEVSKDRICKA